ncbi:MAG TPA: TRAM domain-containing protein, partial [Anaerolineales bacterium]|nr:TRAM domain-containing protein [Anaerolineales bacterium]
QIAADINVRLVGETVEVLVEGSQPTPGAGAPGAHRWKGRTRTNKLVYFDSAQDWHGRLAPVRIEWAGPWSLVGSLVEPAWVESLVAAGEAAA